MAKVKGCRQKMNGGLLKLQMKNPIQEPEAGYLEGYYKLAFNSSKKPLIFSNDCIIANFSSALLFFFR